MSAEAFTGEDRGSLSLAHRTGRPKPANPLHASQSVSISATKPPPLRQRYLTAHQGVSKACLTQTLLFFPASNQFRALSNVPTA
jgi:hypothetical protein